ncbi:OmpA/MotB family protein [Nitrincola sp. MINF-07-Sa-05]|uniref:OmpA/MotB family protein n=1 Tax=Nitrincola salilacus TaxID=3400273 RepID=UPI003917FC59
MSRKQQLMDDSDSPGWLTTYADLMTLLLVFFVLLFSMSSVEREAFSQTMKAFNVALSRDGSATSLIPLEYDAGAQTEIPQLAQPLMPQAGQAPSSQPDARDDHISTSLDIDWEPITAELESALNLMQVGDLVEIGAPLDGKLTLRVNGAVLFQSGSATFNRAMTPMLDAILETLLNNTQYKLEIQGHTDNIPINTAQFPSNWELSAVRATTVLRYMIEGGIPPRRLTATGYGESLPLVRNDTEVNRSINRRIEFVLEKIPEPRL